jgi:predicted GIY-YIG superfamily endonuclease
MGVIDFLGDLFAPSQFKFDKRVWSESHVHELHTTLVIPRGATNVKILKQQARVLGYGGVPDDAGIYLIREYGLEDYIYVGQTFGTGLKTRLKQHLNEEGCSTLQTGRLYEIRYAVTSAKDKSTQKHTYISAYGRNAEQVAEALAILFFRPSHNSSTQYRGRGGDWKDNLVRERTPGNVSAIMLEAKRLGFLRGSTESQRRFYEKVMSVEREKQ